jgi:peptidoglycan-N-acetylglucosamine deacetylase
MKSSKMHEELTVAGKWSRFVVVFAASATALTIIFALFTVFFDQAVLVRRGTIFRVPGGKKLVALTFDDGPSPVWTPQILRELKNTNVHATFFMIGEHAARYPEIARQVAAEGHEVGNHTYNHRTLIPLSPQQLQNELETGERAIFAATGIHPQYFRPPKAWVTDAEKQKIKAMGYTIVLWSLNSKDWVTFDDKYIVNYIVRHIKPGDILLFHDSGGVFVAEGGDRSETVKAIPRLVERLRSEGYEFVTVSQLIAAEAK